MATVRFKCFFPSQAHHKLDSDFVPKILDDVMHLFNPMSVIFNETMYYFPPLLELVECLTSFLDASKTHIHQEQEKSAAEMDNFEQKLKNLERQITHLEESQAEL